MGAEGLSGTFVTTFKAIRCKSEGEIFEIFFFLSVVTCDTNGGQNILLKNGPCLNYS
jgi:hypothetical protein